MWHNSSNSRNCSGTISLYNFLIMKNISLIFLITLLFFILLNLLIVLAWPIYSNLNSNKHNYIDKQKQLLNLSEKQLITLHNETWKNYDKFRFVPFIGHSETDRVGEFVNFSEENGRFVNRPNDCVRNVYLYGGSTTFGYNVTDKQTIGFYLQNLFGENACIYNHGRAYYYSKQENNLFINHLENKKKIDDAVFLDGINERCGGYEYMNQINNSFNLLVERPFLMWKISLKNLINTLPIIQLINSLTSSDRWIQDDDNNILNIKSCDTNMDLGYLYESRVSSRTAICNNQGIECFSFLQPMVGTSGIQIEALLSNDKDRFFKKKYETLQKASGIIDLKYVLENDVELSYIDGVHYSPKSNEIIANEIFKFLN